jgi:hypothetical protein
MEVWAMEPVEVAALGALVGAAAVAVPHSDEAPSPWHHRLLQELVDVHEALRVMTRQLVQASPQEFQSTIAISAGVANQAQNWVELRALGRKHILLFVIGSPQVTFRVPGLGDYNVTLQSGWNIVDIDGAMVCAQPAQAGFPMIVRLSSEAYGNPI